MKKLVLTAALAVTFATPVSAQTKPAPAPTAAVSAVDPARQAIADRVAAKLLPAGTYKTIMKASMSQLTNGMFDKMLDVPMRSFAEIGGIRPDQAAKLGPATLRQIMAIVDPAFDERMKRTMGVMGDLLGDMMDEMEPDIRIGLGHALASRFTLDQLTTLDQFFSTPVGSAYAAQSMAIYADPAVMQRMQNMMPRMMKEMPLWIKRMQAATADLPKPKKPEDLTPADRAKLKALIQADPAATA